MPPPKESRRRSCHEPVWWCVTAAGAKIPIDPVPHEDGNVELTGDDRCRVLTREERRAHRGPLYRSHFSTCESAAQWREGRRPAAAEHAELGGEGGGA